MVPSALCAGGKLYRTGRPHWHAGFRKRALRAVLAVGLERDGCALLPYERDRARVVFNLKDVNDLSKIHEMAAIFMYSVALTEDGGETAFKPGQAPRALVPERASETLCPRFGT